MDLRVRLAGMHLKNPVMSASGTFGYGLEFAPYGDLTSLGAIVVKGLSLEPRRGNPGPRITETSCGLLNAVGLQNVGAKSFVKDKLPLLPCREVPVIANMYGQSSSDFAALAEYLAPQPGVAALELNISCPNVRAGGMQFGQDPKAASAVCKEVKSRSEGKPVIVKLSPNVTDITAIARAVEEAGADAVSLINTLGGLAVDARTRRPVLGNVFGGLSGPAIKPVALAMTYRVCLAVEVPVIGIGGITSAEDILEFILVGAHAVQVGSANFLRPDRIFQLVKELEDLCQDLGLNSWEEYRGGLEISQSSKVNFFAPDTGAS